MAGARTPPGTEPTSEDRAAAEAHRQAERRQFLRQAGIVGGLGVAAGWSALGPVGWPGVLRDPTGERGKPQKRRIQLPEGGFSVPAGPYADLGVAHGDQIPGMVRAAVDGIGGIDRFVQKGDVVVIKPNVAFERAAPLGATSNPEVLAALIHLLRDAGAQEIRVADNPIESPESCFAKSGIRQASVDAGARVYLPTPSDFDILHVPGAKWIENWPFFWRPFQGATKVSAWPR